MSRFRRAAAAAIGTMMTLFCAGSSCLLSDAVVNTSQYPVFGVDATDAAKDAIGKGSMIGTIKQDAANKQTLLDDLLKTIKIHILSLHCFYQASFGPQYLIRTRN